MNNDPMVERAQDLGRMLGQSEEYKALQRARQRVDEDRDAVTALNRLAELENEIGMTLRRGEEPTKEAQEEYERLFSTLQGSAAYQGVVAAQANFDKVLGRVNEEIAKGIEKGAQSKIILS
jgi:cell fate (sporulation/competence/biofilm development) regulator YlbF (YheA/YmcA/DUF963 family)